MALSSAKLNEILGRQKECEKQTQLLQKQVAAFQSYFSNKNNGILILLILMINYFIFYDDVIYNIRS